MNLLHTIDDKLLLGPGPSTVSPEVYSALHRPTLGHLDPQFLSIMDNIKIMLREILKTDNKLTLPISGTGSAAMECCFVNLIEEDDKILIIENGYFGLRMIDMAQRLKANVDVVTFEWGKSINLDVVQDKIDNNNYKIIAVVHAETSTGVLNPIKEISDIIPQDSLFIVDAVTSLGTVDINVDKWNIDAIYSCSQKGLSCPPGASPLSFSEQAIDKLKNRQSKVPNWYLDLSMIINYWEGESRAYHHTAPINMMYALYQGLLNIINEGHHNVLARHISAHEYLVSELKKLDFEFLVEKSVRIPSLNSVIIPKGIDDLNIRNTLLNKYNIEIGGGLGPFSGKIWRIGLMGYAAKNNSIDKLCSALKEIM